MSNSAALERNDKKVKHRIARETIWHRRWESVFMGGLNS
jgi:hypothetical protein